MKEMNPSVFVLRADFGRYTDTFEKEGYRYRLVYRRPHWMEFNG